MGLLVLAWLISLPALIALGVWIVRLASRPAARIEARRYWLRTLIKFGLLLPASLPCVLATIIFCQLYAETAAWRAATHRRLDAPTRIAGIDMPAGTKLELLPADGPDTFRAAKFPAVHTVYGVKTRHISRVVDSRLAPAPAVVTVSIAAEEPTWLDGWRCQAAAGTATRSLSVRVSDDGASAHLESCHAAEGNVVDGFVIPADSEITVATHSPARASRKGRSWSIVPPRQSVFPVKGVPMFHARFQVDGQHRVTTLEHASLACRLSLGTVTYPAGTELGAAEREWRARFPDAWAFMTAPGRQALRDGVAIEAGAWVVQSPDGRVHGVVPPMQTPGPFAHFVVDGEPDPGPPSPESSCDAMMWSWPTAIIPSQALTPQ